MTDVASGFDVVVVSRVAQAADVVVLELATTDGSALPTWTAGSHIDLLLPDGGQRQYSLCGSPDGPRWRVAVLRESAGRGGSAFIHDQLGVGAALRVRGPRNHFALAPSPSYRFIAGGIGITPLLPMIAVAEAAGAEWTLDYAGRSRASMAFAAELLARYGPRVRLHPADESRLDLDALLGAAVPDTLVYACGPTRLLDAVEKLCQTWPAASLHLEHFEATHLHPPLRAEPFEIELVDSGLTLTVPPERSVLEVIEDAGILVLSSCREGTCGTCETPVLEGIVDHRDSVLTPVEQAENRAMMVCCSRAISARLVLEL